MLQIPRNIPTEVTKLLHDGADLAETASQGRAALHDAAGSEDTGITGLLPRGAMEPVATDFPGTAVYTLLPQGIPSTWASRLSGGAMRTLRLVTHPVALPLEFLA